MASSPADEELALSPPQKRRRRAAATRRRLWLKSRWQQWECDVGDGMTSEESEESEHKNKFEDKKDAVFKQEAYEEEEHKLHAAPEGVEKGNPIEERPTYDTVEEAADEAHASAAVNMTVTEFNDILERAATAAAVKAAEKTAEKMRCKVIDLALRVKELEGQLTAECKGNNEASNKEKVEKATQVSIEGPDGSKPHDHGKAPGKKDARRTAQPSKEGIGGLRKDYVDQMFDRLTQQGALDLDQLELEVRIGKCSYKTALTIFRRRMSDPAVAPEEHEALMAARDMVKSAMKSPA